MGYGKISQSYAMWSDKRVIQDCITRLFNQSPSSIYVDQMINIYICIWAPPIWVESLGVFDHHSRRSSKKIRRQSRRCTNRVDRSRSIYYHWPWPEFRMCFHTATYRSFLSFCDRDGRQRSIFRWVHSGKSSGENTIFSSLRRSSVW